MKFDNIRRNQICPCGSGKKFKQCHGDLSDELFIKENNPVVAGLGNNGYYIESLLDPVNDEFVKDLPSKEGFKHIPPGILVIEDFIDNKLCKKIIGMTEKNHHIKATIVETDINNTTKEEEIVETERKTEIFFLEQYNSLIRSVFEKTFKEVVNDFYKQEVKCYEQPHILRYSKGGFYHYHADSETWDNDKNKWYKSMQRDISFLLYLNDDYTGGELVFKNFRFSMKPKKGMFVAFPSDHRFIHKVMPTLSGLRYAIVSWAASEKTMKSIKSSQSTNQVILIQ